MIGNLHIREMAMPNTLLRILAAGSMGLAAAASAVDGQRAERAGAYTVHYNAIPTTALGAEIARGYGFTRSGNRGLINIAVLHQPDPAVPGTGVPARIEASVRNLAGQRVAIALREVRDTDAIYYIGEFAIRGSDQLRFELAVTPEGSNRPIAVRFEQAFDSP